MRFTRTIVTMSGLALAGLTALTGVGEGTADANPAEDHIARPATYLAAFAGEAGYEPEVYEADVAGHAPPRVVATAPDNGIVDVERAPDGTGWYAYVIGDSMGIRRIGSDRDVAEGWAPAVSPDGRRLAFAYFPAEPEPCDSAGVAVLELATGDVRRFPGPSPDFGPRGCPEGEGLLTSISWAPDSRRLAFERILYMAGRATLRVVDTGTARDLADAELLDPAHAYSHPAWLADGRIAVTEPDPDHGVRIMAVDPDTGRATEFAPANGHDIGRVTGLDADASGRHLLVSAEGEAHSTRLFALAEGGTPEELEPAYGIAVW